MNAQRKNVTDAEAEQNAVATITTKSDEASRVAEVDDGGTVLGSTYRAAGPPTTASYRSVGVGPLPSVAMLLKALNISEMVGGLWHAARDHAGSGRTLGHRDPDARL
ncbi:MAG: hypothetical protein ACQESR_20025 [Planctomycetota bacterium]